MSAFSFVDGSFIIPFLYNTKRQIIIPNINIIAIIATIIPIFDEPPYAD